jgi:hypothetical protein
MVRRCPLIRWVYKSLNMLPAPEQLGKMTPRVDTPVLPDLRPAQRLASAVRPVISLEGRRADREGFQKPARPGVPKLRTLHFERLARNLITDLGGRAAASRASLAMPQTLPSRSHRSSSVRPMSRRSCGVWKPPTRMGGPWLVKTNSLSRAGNISISRPRSRLMCRVRSTVRSERCCRQHPRLADQFVLKFEPRQVASHPAWSAITAATSRSSPN